MPASDANGLSARRGYLFVDVIARSLLKWGDRLLFDQPDGERSYTYLETADLITRIIGVLEGYGAGRGDGIGLLTVNCPEAWMVSQAPQINGGYFTALPARSSVDDLAYIVENAELSAIVVHPALAELGSKVAERSPALKQVFSLGPSDLAPDLLALADKVSARRLQAAPGIGHEDLTHLWYTGGTTGRPRAAILTQRSMMQSVWKNLISHDLELPLRYAVLGPLSHTGYPHSLPTVVAGGSMTAIRDFDPERFVHLTQDKRLNTTAGVPTMLYAISDYVEKHGEGIPTMRRFVYGGSPIPGDRLAQLHDRFGQIFTQLYGMSETVGTATALLPHEHDVTRPERLMSCGRPVPGAEVAILDDELNPVRPGEVGEICVRAETMMAGYWKEPEMTEAAFAGGWFHTGDLGRSDDEGYYTIVDRKKDMVISGGFNVYSTEVEAVLTADPRILQAAVIGVPDPKWVEAVHAVVVIAEGQTIDAQEIKDLVREKKGAVYAPKGVEFIDALPQTATGKVDKKALRAPYWKGHERRI